MRKILVMIILTGLVASCASGKHFFGEREIDSSSLVGKVYDGDNQSCDGVRITLEDEKGNVSSYTAISDVTGSFYFSERPFGIYKISARKDGYREEIILLDLNQPNQTLYLVMYDRDQLLALCEDMIYRKRYDRADELLDDIYTLEEDSREGLFLEAILSWRLGLIDEALDLMDRLMAMEPDNHYLEEFKALLDEGDLSGS
ncbi:MAG: carboxypeptidase regulatory-like domain-containing protein [Spirochaetales bacterium]|nr:carboxypeptidase regulatory-like domain-containing protein [Spirochaetales bacterium]